MLSANAGAQQRRIVAQTREKHQAKREEIFLEALVERKLSQLFCMSCW